ncbi:hypothetical protein [Pseudomonas sp. W5-01]|uniref:hypothetical protein n=1 Tax=Pseudomonas sp. W5-01 TaxID=3097454 RepID=UPI00397E288A
MNLLDGIRAGAKKNTPYHEIARKIFFTYPTFAFVEDEERQYSIFNEISEHFKIPILAIHVAGSAKTGHSFHKGTPFIPGVSDLDIAIIDAGLFQRYMELVCSLTRNYSDLTAFRKVKGVSQHVNYVSYLSKGIFRPDLMPYGPDRADINDFFGRLSSRHGDLFRSINAALYMSQSLFETKQRSAVSNFLEKDIY